MVYNYNIHRPINQHQPTYQTSALNLEHLPYVIIFSLLKSCEITIFPWFSQGFPIKTSIFPWFFPGFPVVSPAAQFRALLRPAAPCARRTRSTQRWRRPRRVERPRSASTATPRSSVQSCNRGSLYTYSYTIYQWFTLYGLYQWPFQDPRLEVPIYISYISNLTMLQLNLKNINNLTM